MKLTYWMSQCLNDSDSYNIRAKTKREALDKLTNTYDPEGYGPVKKVTVEYDDGFDLMVQCLDEGRGYWEA